MLWHLRRGKEIKQDLGHFTSTEQNQKTLNKLWGKILNYVTESQKIHNKKSNMIQKSVFSFTQPYIT